MPNHESKGVNTTQMVCRIALALFIVLPSFADAASSPRKERVSPRISKSEKKPVAKSTSRGSAPARKKGKNAVNVNAIMSDSEILSLYKVDQENLGYVVVDLDSGQVVEKKNSLNQFIPASVAKVPTTVAALEILGPEHRFETSLFLGNVPNIQIAPPDIHVNQVESKNGDNRDTIDHVYQPNGVTPEQIAAGNLYLKGGGDPFLTTADLMGLASKLKKMGITRWTGNYYYDTSLIANPDRIDNLQEDDASYNPGVSALSVDFNRYIFSWSPSKSGRGILETVTTPDLPSVDIRYSLQQLGWSGEVLPSKPWESIRIRSEKNSSGSVWLPVRNPSYHAALLFQKLCSSKGVELPPPVKTVMTEPVAPLVIHKSQPLIKLVEQTLEHSNNLMAELIGMAASRQVTGKALSLKNSGEALLNWYKQKIPQAHWEGFFLENHSGLSSNSKVTPEQMVGILRYADTHPYNDKSYVSLLPISGWTGTLARRLGDPMTALKVWAKTGTIHYASGLSGHLYSQSKRRLAFAVFVTNHTERENLTQKIKLSKNFSEAQAKNWNRRAKAVENALVRRWIQRN